MAFLRQLWALVYKNLLHLLVRRWFTTPLRALILPVIFVFILCYSKNWSADTTNYGVGIPYRIKTLEEAFAATSGSLHTKLAICDHGFKTGDVSEVVKALSDVARANGKQVHIVSDSRDFPKICPANPLGKTECFAAIDFKSSPDHQADGVAFTGWRYTLYTDSQGVSVHNVDSGDNAIQLYRLPLQHFIDSKIQETHGGQPLTPDVYSFPYTYQTNAEKNKDTNENFASYVQDIFGFALFVGICGVTYHLTGFMALERERGFSALIEAMMPNARRWEPQIARLLSYHVTFDLLYLPSWILIGVVISIYAFPATDIGILVGGHILFGLSLTSYSLFCGTLFRRAYIAGITVVLVSILIAVAAQFGLVYITGTTNGAILATGILFPSMNYVYFLFILASFQLQDMPAVLSEPFVQDGITWSLSGATILGIAAAQIIYFPLLAIFSERLLHGSSSRKRKLNMSDKRIAARMDDFSRHYNTTTFWGMVFCCRSRKWVKAVNNLSFELARGAITVLLGANGSGKTTTLNTLAGIDRPTSGMIHVDGTGGLGICPQANVLWDDLTVDEHVKIFDLLKSVGSVGDKDGRLQLIQKCDLEIKRNSRAGQLSGGQKRKLQLAMMFIGGSKVCCVDEVSSGIDPLARKKIWDILLAERGKRTILLTTHFMDEADVIADHVAIMSKGYLKAQGSVAELKHSLGDGFEVIVPGAPRIAQTPHHMDRGRSVYQFEDSRDVAHFTDNLEKVGILEYQVQSPTMEDVFLKMADEIKDQARVEERAVTSSSSGTEKSATIAVEEVDDLYNLSSGRKIGLLNQFWTLFCKRFIVLRTSWLAHGTALFIPILGSYLVTLFFKTFYYPNGIPCPTAAPDYYQNGLEPYYLSGENFVYGPPSQISLAQLNTIIPGQFPVPPGGYNSYSSYSSSSSYSDSYSGPPPTVDSYGAFYSYVQRHRVSLYTGGIFDAPNGTTIAFTAGYYGNDVATLLQNVANNLLGTAEIRFENGSFESASTSDAFSSLILVVLMALVMTVYPAILGQYPALERVQNVRSLQYCNGIRTIPLWCAHLAFDLCFIIIISGAAVGIWASQYSGWYHVGYLFPIFALFGMATTAFAYVVGLFAKSPLACFAFAAAIQMALMLIQYAGYIATTSFAPGDLGESWINIEYFTVGLITPSGSLLRALFVSLNDFRLDCGPNGKLTNPSDITRYGGPIVYLIGQFLVLMAFVIYWDAGGRFTLIRRVPKDVHVEESGSNVIEEPKRLSQDNDGLRVLNLSKSFGQVKAVEHVSFGVYKSEAFALLGPNGAGKSTVISLIRGDFRQTGHAGDVFIDGDSIARSRGAARAHLGTCPQFDAVDAMTVIQHLRFYARCRGVDDVERNVRIVIDAIGLRPFENRYAKKLSGGNKRRLSLAIALVGNPAVLILDEPSTGMDAAAKRVLWKVLSILSSSRALIITTHSMEEADTLCQRAGIMAGRMLALGTTEDLRKRYSDSSYVHLVHKNAPHCDDADMDRIRDWVFSVAPQTHMDRHMYHGQIRFSVPNGSPVTSQGTEQCSAGVLFRLLEANKEQLGVSHFTVGGASLDQVFLSVVHQHNVEEENYREEEKSIWKRFF